MKQTKKVTWSLTIGHLTASFFIRATILPLTAPFSWAVTSLGTLAGFSTEKMGTSYLVGGTDKGYPDGLRGRRLYRVRSKPVHLHYYEGDLASSPKMDLRYR